jgi:hypothetical protein
MVISCPREKRPLALAASIHSIDHDTAMSTSSPPPVVIPDYPTGSALIARIPLANSSAAIHDLDRILDGLFAAPPDHQTYFRVLECARPPIALVIEDLSRRYIDKPVPLGDVEDAFFRETVNLWLKTAKAYTHCIERIPPDSGPPPADHLATLLHRSIHFTGMAILEHHRARREPPMGLWLDLHSHYKMAEDMHLATLEIPGILETHTGPTHCTAAYLAVILCEMADASNLAMRDLKLLRRWTSIWSMHVDLRPGSGEKTLPFLVIDLMQDAALRPSSEYLHIDRVRCLDISRLSDQIARIRRKLRKGIPPSQIGMGDDCTPQQCTRLLNHLTRQWSQSRTVRKFRRRAMSGSIRVCTDFTEMYYFISGQSFQQPESARMYSRNDFDNVYSLRFQENPQQAIQARPSSHALAAYNADTWEAVDQSANGFRLMRSISGRKMAHGQLLALCPRDSDHFFLAQITWLMQENKGGLTAGIRALPGLPQAISARPVAARGEPIQPYQPAFLLPALETTGTGPSLVLPKGWFRIDRLIEIFIDEAWRIRLRGLLDSGPDFERVEFEDGRE